MNDGLILGSSGGSGFDIVVQPMRLPTLSAPTVLALTSPLGFPHSVQCWLCTSASVLVRLAELLRGQLNHVPVSKHFLASSVVSGFDVSSWD